MPYWCRDCRSYFSVRTGTALERSKVPLRKWAIAIYLELTSLNSVSSMKLHRDIGVTQATAWFMLHRIRQAWFDTDDDGSFNGPVEVDETYFGGKRQNMSRSKRKALTGRGPVGKTAVVGAKDRATNQVSAKVVTSTDSETLQGFVKDNADPDATIYTDEATAYESLPFDHETVKHSVGEYVKGQAHINRVESFWATLKRAHKGTFHKISPKHPKPLRPRVRWQAQYPRSRDACADDDSCRSSCRQAANAQRPHRG
ncbi:MAG: IS1595 family transposase [Bryobacterales bacterium]|nr:IS1595 family transposase [Bryobacterales bacterium]